MARQHDKISQPIGIASALVCLGIVVARSGNPVAIKVVLQSLSPLHGAFARVAIGCASVGLYSFAQRRELRPRRNELGPLALLTAIYAVQISFNQTGSDYTSPVFVAILFNTYPITANFASSFFVPEDRLTRGRLIGLAAAFAGVVWIFLAPTESALAPNPVLGNSLILAAATLLALRMVYLRQLVLRIDYAKAVFWPLLFSLPLFLIGAAFVPGAIPRVEPDWRIWAALLYQGIVVGGIGQLAWTYLVRKHTPGTVIVFSFLMPVCGLALSALYFSEPVPPRLLEGLCAILAGIALAARRAPTAAGPAPSGPSPRISTTA